MSPPVAVATPAAAPNSTYALFILSLINLVNYLDRYIVTVALPHIQRDFQLDNTQAGLLGSFFMVVFMLASPISGFLGDRVPRRFLVAGGVLLWSLATGASGLASTFAALMVARACVGIGEAGYGAVAPSIISDLFPREQRTRVLSIFYIAIPVGAAAGYGLGGWLSNAYSWHVAFYAGGVPGIILAVMAFFMPEPQRGAMDGPDAQKKLPFLVGLKGLGRNPAFWWTTSGYTLMTFSIGGLAFWLPSFLVNERGITLDRAGFLSGAVTALAGLTGTIAGGWLGDRMDRRMPGGGLRLSGVGLLLAAPLMVLAVRVSAQAPMFAIIFMAQFLIFLNSGPINAAIVNGVPPAFRAFAMGLNVLFIHMLGDALSPTVIGRLADVSSLAVAIQVNAIPVLLGGLALLMAGKAFRHVNA
ncbi:4-hydroxybenzoate transporter [Cystobacter fuscus DSM 2262]|uniref:4-hydroxybenzoate transporter n=1 Tax=Cystobacter fuscus (strain ATCC 25194 / DSM 2262 / NBRC 100088 / M29) TaxID=1242864 RepID=S9PFL2_CYSF2|nr:MFS transporter [Cystobacter fuscus]EPX63170.1 4-hydroxybenzoate transporter [Cystobacter fuscus DSM 2262]